MLQVHRQAKEQRSHLRRALCFDDDANFRHAAAAVNEEVTGCADAADHCNDQDGVWTDVMFFCPKTCNACNDCNDHDDAAVFLGDLYGLRLAG